MACSDGDIYANNIRSNGEQLPEYVGVEPRGWGLLLYNSVDFVIYGNFFENNRIQAGDTKSGEKNLWDRGYPRGGNHWSDYDGIDKNSGSGQDITGSDGVGDTPYQVGHDSGDYLAYATDRYPLMP